MGGVGLLHGLGGVSRAAAKIPHPTIATFPTAMCHAAMRMMTLKGFYKKYGPEGLRLAVLSSWDPVREGLIGGKLHMAYGGGLDSVVMIEKGMPFVLTGAIHKGCVMGASQPEIKSWKDMKGKTLAVNVLGSFPYFIALSHLTDAGLDYRKDLKIVVVSPPDMIAAFKARKVDAISMWDPIIPLLAELKIEHNILYDIGKDPGWRDQVCCSTMFHKDFVKEHPGMVWQFNECIQAACRFLASGDAAAREAAELQTKAGYVPGTAKVDFQYRLIKSYDWTVAGDQDRALKSIRFYAELGRKFGVIKRSVDDLVKLAWVDYTKLPKTPV